MQFDLVRDFLDAIHVTHPKPGEGQQEVKANVGVRFCLPALTKPCIPPKFRSL